MKNVSKATIIVLVVFVFFLTGLKAQNPVNWTSKQLMEPSELATAIQEKNELPVIISIGPGAVIPGTVAIGMVNNSEGINKLKQYLDGVEKNRRVVIYCGCCPFEHCPNVRPAIVALKQLHFTNYYLLNLPSNIKKDWIDKGYPVAK